VLQLRAEAKAARPAEAKPAPRIAEPLSAPGA